MTDREADSEFRAYLPPGLLDGLLVLAKQCLIALWPAGGDSPLAQAMRQAVRAALHARPTDRYVIRHDGNSIFCFTCCWESYHPEDVAQHYCGRCHVFHDDEAAKVAIAAARGKTWPVCCQCCQLIPGSMAVAWWEEEAAWPLHAAAIEGVHFLCPECARNLEEPTE